MRHPAGSPSSVSHRRRGGNMFLISRLEAYNSKNPILTDADADAFVEHFQSTYPEYRRHKDLFRFVQRHLKSNTEVKASFSHNPSNITTPEQKEQKQEQEQEIESERDGPTFEDIGGIDDVVELLDSEVVFSLCHQELFPKFGSDHALRSILLHGPPGCGKTTLARAIANEAGMPLYQVSALDIVSGVSGESERNIRDIFEKASRTTPSVLVIDEVGVIGGKIDDAKKGMETRIVSELIRCMDDFCDPRKPPLVVIGTTNRPHSIDPYLRAMFKSDLSLNVPNENTRKMILSVLIEKLKLDVQVDLTKIAKSTSGFVGRDLVTLVSKAGTLAVKKVYHKRKLQISQELKGADSKDVRRKLKQPWTPQEIEDLDFNITATDFEEAAMSVQPSLKREGFSSIPDVTWDDVGGLTSIREEFDFHIVQHIKNPEIYERIGKLPQIGFLLYGPPGCGKTLIAKAVANQAGANFIYIKGPDLLDKYFGESESKIRAVFTRARTCPPCILFFDEIDALATKRGEEGGSAVNRVVNQLLIELDGEDKRHGVYVIGATNRIEALDPAMLRPGRLGEKLYVPLPGPEDRTLILKTIARKMSCSADMDLDLIGRSESCNNFSGADLHHLMDVAASFAIKEIQMALKHGNPNLDYCFIRPAHIEQALTKVSPSVSKKERLRYEKLSRKFKATKT